MKLLDALNQWKKRDQKLREIAPNDLISEKQARSAQKWIDQGFALAERLRALASRIETQAEVNQDNLNEARILMEMFEGEGEVSEDENDQT